MRWFAPASRTAVAEAGEALAPVSGGPKHVAIIMDGNGRWAKARRLPRLAGHRAGVESVRRVVRAAPQLGIETLTLYAFSSENWSRPADEVSDLMGLLRHHLLAELDELTENGVRLRLIGDWKSMRPDVVAGLDRALNVTSTNRGMQLVVALNYGAQDEMIRAVRTLAEAAKRGDLDPGSITPDMMAAGLDTADLPPVDLIIRSSGEQRLSNFLLWQAAYAEFWFTETLWPDFDEATLRQAAEVFAARERRFGGR